MKAVDFDETLSKDLRDLEFAAAYLEDALSESNEEFLIALRIFVQANGGADRCAEKTGLAREAIYRMLSEKGNPELRSVRLILSAYGLRFSVQRELVAA